MADTNAAYAELRQQIGAVIDGEPNSMARYATAACLIHLAFQPRFLWTGFYLVDPDKPQELVVGPYQGTLGCLRIPIGQGVCGAAAAQRQTVLVKDVHAFEGHIACDSRSNSEIVVPVIAAHGDLLGVLDVDSAEVDAFDAQDQAGLEAIAALLAEGA